MKAISSFKFAGNAVLLGLALLLSTSSGKAQIFRGTFTLPNETHWGYAVLPAGNYTLRMESMAVPHIAVVRGEGKTVTLMAAAADQGVASQNSRLTILNSEGKHYVQSLEAREIGLTFSYRVPKAVLKLTAEGRSPAQRVTYSPVGK